MSLTCLPTSARTRWPTALRASPLRACLNAVKASSGNLASTASTRASPGLHAPLAESAARLLVRQNILQRNDFLGHAGQPSLRGVDHRQPFVELAQIVAGRPCMRLQPRSQTLADMIEPLGNQPREI